VHAPRRDLPRLVAHDAVRAQPRGGRVAQRPARRVEVPVLRLVADDVHLVARDRAPHQELVHAGEGLGDLDARGV